MLPNTESQVSHVAGSGGFDTLEPGFVVATSHLRPHLKHCIAYGQNNPSKARLVRRRVFNLLLNRDVLL